MILKDLTLIYTIRYIRRFQEILFLIVSSDVLLIVNTTVKLYIFVPLDTSRHS